MPQLAANGDQDPGDNGADVLGDVSLKFFNAQPAAIGPFGASVLNWAVEGPPGFHVRLNNRQVAKKGQQVVHPTSTTSFRLSAHAGQASRTLGNVQVSVDRSSCETYDIGNPQSAIRAPVTAQINNSGDLYFRSDPGISVTFSPGRIRLRLTLAKRQNNFPDPSVDIDATFGLTVNDGALIPFGEQISVDVSVPFWAWFIPGAFPGLAIALDQGKEDARKQTHEAIQGIAQILSFHALPPQGLRLSTVRIDDGNNGAGVIELTACKQDLLVRYAELSELAVLT